MPGKMWFIHSEDAAGERTNVFEWDTGLSITGPNTRRVRELIFTGAATSPFITGSVVAFVKIGLGQGNMTLKGNAGDTGIPVQSNVPTVLSTRDGAVANISVDAALTVSVIEI